MRLLLDFFSGLFAPRTGWNSNRNTFFNKVRTRARHGRGRRSKLGGALFAIAFIAAIAGLVYYFYLQPKSRHTGVTPRGDRFSAGYSKLNLEPATAFHQGIKPRAWKYIVVHHSASAGGSAQIFDDWHRSKGWRGLGYHFVIGNGSEQGDGVIVAGSRWLDQQAGAHANSAEFNENGIGICLVGNFEEKAPSPAQWAAVQALIKRLCADFNIPKPNIFGHNQIRRGGTTACPGKYLNLEALKEGL